MTTTTPMTLEAALAALPAEVEDLKELMRRAGIRGSAEEPPCFFCPVALYLSAVTERDIGVSRVFAWDRHGPDQLIMRKLPLSAAAFVNNYDAGRESEFAPAKEQP